MLEHPHHFVKKKCFEASEKLKILFRAVQKIMTWGKTIAPSKFNGKFVTCVPIAKNKFKKKGQ
jgi:hypothetical protein